MLQTIKLDSWGDFEKIIGADLLEKTQQLRTGPSFYRGHPDATWRLETTLERYTGLGQSVSGHYSDILKLHSQIETFTDRKWQLPTTEDYSKNLTAGGLILTDQIIVYMQYLRHFGYPSPLLDWSLSPFVAAYFAFRDVSNKAESVAIYDFLAGSELWVPPLARYMSESTGIYPISTASPRNKRHYLQQSVYTVCLKKINRGIFYASHEDPTIMGSEEKGASYGEAIAKYIIPASERITALNSLEAYNINAYSLMGTEESLLETLFLRHYKREEINRRLFPDM